jgi:hypothetical protein
MLGEWVRKAYEAGKTDATVVMSQTFTRGRSPIHERLIKNPFGWDYSKQDYHWRTHLLRTGLSSTLDGSGSV